jgi:hypothetical protein
VSEWLAWERGYSAGWNACLASEVVADEVESYLKANNPYQRAQGETAPPLPVPDWLERERAQWQGVINDWAGAYARQGRELDALKQRNCEHVTYMDDEQFDELARTLDDPDDVFVALQPAVDPGIHQ